MTQNRLLKTGDIVALNETHTVYARIPWSKAYPDSENGRNNQKLVSAKVTLSGDHEDLQGEYKVVKTEKSGGGYGHGKHDYYPDGHKVFCKKIDSGVEVSFYQTGSFLTMIRDISPIRTDNNQDVEVRDKTTALFTNLTKLILVDESEIPCSENEKNFVFLWQSHCSRF